MTKETSSLPELTGFNFSSAAKMLGGNHELLLRLVLKFPKNHGRTAIEIAEALKEGDEELAYRLAHTLKSVSGTIGAEDVQKCASKLVIGLKNRIDITDELLEMETVLQDALHSIKQLE